MANKETKEVNDSTTEEPTVSYNTVQEYSTNREVVNFIKKKFKRLNKQGAINLIKHILSNNIHIKIKDFIRKEKTFYQYNMSKFDKDYELKFDELTSIRRELNGYLIDIGKDIIQYDENKHGDLKLKIIDGEQCFILDNKTLYRKVRELVCDEDGDICFKYNFKKPDMELNYLQNKELLQRCEIQILSNPLKFDYPVEYEYTCPTCHNKTKYKAYEVASTNNAIYCPNYREYLNQNGEPKSKLCSTKLYPDSEICTTRDAYYYDISYEDEGGNKHSIGALSYEKYKPGFYECVLFKIKNPRKTEIYQIMDIKDIESNNFVLPEKVNGENYVFTLQRAFDSYIKKQTGVEIYGLIPIKVSLILQCVFQSVLNKLIANIQCIGSPSTGKSLVLKYYGFALNNHLNMSSNGLSISIPGLRGTKVIITLMGKDCKIITIGYLGTFKSIHIDEAGENRELVQNLKTFLLEDNYGYDKAGATGISNKRTAHINVSENLDYAHLGQYRGMIRKTYKDLNITIGSENKEEWDENWDLHLPLYKYTNLYLRKVIKEKRRELEQSQKFWIDGYEMALHERFPFYFYLVNENENNELARVVRENDSRHKTISENVELMKVLKSEDIDNFFNGLKDYIRGTNDEEHFIKVDKILLQYGLNADARTKSFFHNLLKASRIINSRKTINEEDFMLMKYIIEKTNCRLDVSNTIDYKITNPPNIKEEEEIDLKIEEETKEVSSEFGIPEGEF